TSPDQTLQRIASPQIIMSNKTILSRVILQQVPQLQYIGVLATGYDVIDTTAARELDITVANVPSYGTDSVAQMVFAHILNLTQRVADHSADVLNGGWSRCPDYSYSLRPLIELAGQTLGIIGLGRIGRQTAHIARAFNMNVIACDPNFAGPNTDNIPLTDLDELIKTSDFITLHCPLNDQTKNIINQSRLALMKKSAFLINTSRGPLIDETALAIALNNNQIAGAALDVLSTEPPTPENPLFKAKNITITPHNAWATRAARQRLLNTAIENLIAFLQGNPQNVVNKKPLLTGEKHDF
ncbi:MAG: D-2-hydroxyacid dehydrogenase, partial [Planctomycetes bacterium]|nr:D-2-hydroxyacid dehydrogenase [Planctomycetota bacterium]